ncbi:uncharacterized protein RCC_06992 [Ramularia collo-cygni]|uniref:Uncharacterized protein n=1 Tax=Ramularia collo-cygni TaxID=112498 RepID=A0A2D3UWH9_9PEZI|nr:uncharacterized protein RCC_06992 [Ramularia collo-cygni]CZT21131.1 uncharacterized protein RCC_06992 [Ramularia collo-cygni]
MSSYQPRITRDIPHEDGNLVNETADPIPPPPHYETDGLRRFHSIGVDLYAVDWLIYKPATSANTPTIPEIQLKGIFGTLAKARRAAGFGSLNLRVLREDRLSSADFEALDTRRRELQGDNWDEQSGVVIPVIRRSQYYLEA